MSARVRRFLWMFVRIVVSGGLLAYLVTQVDLAKLAAIWRGVALPPLLLGVALQLAGVLISALKWWLLLRASDQRVPYWWTVRAYFIGQFFNNFLPTMIGGDAVRAYQLSQRTGRTAGAIVSVFVERLLGFLALTCIAAVALLLNVSALNAELRWASVVALVCAAGALCAALAAPLLMRLLLRVRLPTVVNWRGKLAGTAQAVAAYYHYRRTLALVIALSFAYQLVWIGSNYALARALGLPISYGFMALIVPLSDIVGLIPVFLNSLGAREGTFVLFLGQRGVAAEVALALAWVIFVARLGVSLLGGVFYLWGGLVGPRRSLAEELHAVQRSRSAEKPELRS